MESPYKNSQIKYVTKEGIHTHYFKMEKLKQMVYLTERCKGNRNFLEKSGKL